ncbi:MAG TPA: GNAT family N-acetyltransferase, partial [Polyangiales bacterium]|nr:GNAT family N-acetyltransferase [Polyangiales bacterium]
MTVRIRRIREEDWAIARALRLRSLLDDPDAFASTWGQENALTEADWRARARSNAEGRTTVGFFALSADREVGAAVGRRRDAVVELNAMWVAPEARRQGAAR